jgi:16S rRNA G527 N7-methylase RsmG
MITKEQLEEWNVTCESYRIYIRSYECTHEQKDFYLQRAFSAIPALIDWCEQLTASIDLAHSNYDRLLKDYQEQKILVAKLESTKFTKNCDTCKYEELEDDKLPCRDCTIYGVIWRKWESK